MCGRITRTSPQESITQEFGVTRFAEVDWQPHYNVAPSQIVEGDTLRRRREAPWTNALGLRLAHSEGSEARPDQREGRGPIHLTDVPGRVPTPALPSRGGWFLRVEKERRTKKDAVLHPPQVWSAVRFRGHLVPQTR